MRKPWRLMAMGLGDVGLLGLMTRRIPRFGFEAWYEYRPMVCCYAITMGCSLLLYRWQGRLGPEEDAEKAEVEEADA